MSAPALSSTHAARLFAPGIAALLLAAPLAAERFQPASEPHIVEVHLPDGVQIERRLDHDLDGDGLIDVVVLSEVPDQRKVLVLLAFNDEFDTGFREPEVLELDPVPVNGTALRLERNVLVVEEITGGTARAEVRWRFRWDPKLAGMRLIGDDLRRPPTSDADALTVSTNRLNGRQVITEGERRLERTIPMRVIGMADVPDPFDVTAEAATALRAR
ncbi:MAG: hypothetical protein ACRC2H_06280 [Silanimonas sp.]